MPKLRRTLARGATTAFGIPRLIVAIPLTLLVLWEGLVARGFQGPFTALGATFALPPITTFVDFQILGAAVRAPIDATGLRAAAPGFGGFAAVLLFHAFVNAIVATTSVERLRTGSVSDWAIKRTAHVMLTTLSVGFMSLGLLLFGAILGTLLSALFGLFAQFLGLVSPMVIGIYLFGFAPAIATDEDRRLTDTLLRSVRTGRMPGSSNLWIAVLYVAISLVLVPPIAGYMGLAGSTIGVTPTAAAWAISILANVMHVIVQTTLAYRYLVVAPEVSDQPTPRRARSARR